MTFKELKLISSLLKALEDKNYTEPTSIQCQAIPPIIEGRDMMAEAQTGTGKTAAFTLPLLQRLAEGQPAKPNAVRALILTPTRELAAQVHESAEQYGKHMSLKSASVFGGVKINPQMMKLTRGVDVLVATPGRLMDLYQQNAVKFNQVEIFVLDEADRMLDMGFIADIKKIMALMPKQRQNLMFSATFSDEIRKLARELLNDPVAINVNTKNATATTVTQFLHPVDKAKKTKLLSYLIKHNNWEQVLVFTRTKRGANKLAQNLGKVNIEAVAIHGDKSQGARTRALANFKQGKAKVMVATDIAARGIDITDLPHVVNFDLPDTAENYVHRIGRTGRGGSEGAAISLVSADEVDVLSDIEHLIGQLLPRTLIDGFEPDHDLPITTLDGKKGKSKPKHRGNGARKTSFSSDKKPGQRQDSRRSRSSSSDDRSSQARKNKAAKPKWPNQA